jgi:hypothetical protein
MTSHPPPTCAPIEGAPAIPGRDAARQWKEGSETHIDVRGLSPPQPLVSIIRLVRSLPPDARVVVHHDRDPLLLYPELAELGWGAARIDADPGEIRLLLCRLT